MLRRRKLLVSLLSLLTGGALVVLLQTVFALNRPLTPSSVKMALRVTQDRELEDGASSLVDFETIDSRVKELTAMNRASQLAGTRRGGSKHVIIPGFSKGSLGIEPKRTGQGMDLVIRFNKLQSYKCGEKFDVWASRHGDAVTTRYWGIGQKLNVTGCSFEKLLSLSRHIWLMNGGDGPFNYFLDSYKSIKEKGNYAWLDCRIWVLNYMRRMDPKVLMGVGASTQDEISPSSGWLILTMMKDCAPPGTKVHVFGFNWPPGQWPVHKVEEEKKDILQQASRGRLVVHATPCQHKYTCS